MIKVPLENPQPDIERFIQVIRGEKVPQRPPLVELFLDFEIEREICRGYFNRDYPWPTGERDGDQLYHKNRIDVYFRMGYDYIRTSGGIDFPSEMRIAEDTAEMSRGNRGWANENAGPIASWSDFERYPWPNLDNVDLSSYEFVSRNLPEGMGLFACPASGFFEIPCGHLLGYQSLCYLAYDNPQLVAAVFQKVGETLYGFYEKLIGLPNLYGFFQGDDMGFGTGTMVSPDILREHVLPWHKRLARLAHDNGLVYLLHSCGNLEQIMPDLIDDVKIDGRHSFEDKSTPVIDFKRKHGDRVATLGGIDIDKLCRLPEDQLRAHTRKIIEECLPGGRFALGSGNTVCNYIPLKSYFAMVEEALNFG
jgi:uroporphyrinogen decarboxylase